nr:hypothetical protein [uncultured Flavobacterium sp.]
MKLYFIFFINIFFISNLFSQNNVEGLTIRFIKLSEDYVYPGAGYGRFDSSSPSAADGMIFMNISIKMKNEGNKDCVFNLDDAYVSTEQDSLYRFYRCYRIEDNSVKIRPQKEMTRAVVVQFPDKMTPKELFIEDKRYKIILEKNK